MYRSCTIPKPKAAMLWCPIPTCSIRPHTPVTLIHTSTSGLDHGTRLHWQPGVLVMFPPRPRFADYVYIVEGAPGLMTTFPVTLFSGDRKPHPRNYGVQSCVAIIALTCRGACPSLPPTRSFDYSKILRELSAMSISIMTTAMLFTTVMAFAISAASANALICQDSTGKPRPPSQ